MGQNSCRTMLGIGMGMGHVPESRSMERTTSPASRWHQHARRTARRLNVAWWLQGFAPWVAALGLITMGVLLWWRSRGDGLPAGQVALGLVAVYGLAGLGCWMAARPRFVRPAAGLVLLEARLKLNNALSAATLGVTAWPPVPDQVDDGLSFRGTWLLAPALLTTACLAFAFLLPLPRTESRAELPPPLALARAESMINALQKEELVDSAELEKAKDKLSALLAQPPGEFYSHHSLEAADALESSLSEAAGNLGSHLQAVAQTAQSLERYDSTLTPSARQQLEGDLRASVEGLRNSSMGISESLQKQLSQLDPSKLKELDPEQLKQMLANLQAKSAACKNCQGNGSGQEGREASQALQDLLNGKAGGGKGEGAGSGKEGEGMGRGGLNRGPGTGPLTFEQNPTDLGTNNPEEIESRDLSRSLPGDHLGTKDIEHHLEKTPEGPSAGGALAAPAGGGEAVWRDQLLPSEQKVLRRYFK